MTHRLSRAHFAEIGLLLCVLFIASYLRLGNPGIVEYKRDEANLSILALDFVSGGPAPLLGIGSSIGVPNAPINVYVLSLPYLLGNNPQLATQFIGLLNVMAIVLTYAIARRYVGYPAALLAILLYATSPWGVVFSRKIWAQNMLPFFLMLTFWVGLKGYSDRNRFAQFAFPPLVVALVQIHYGAFVAIPGLAYLIWKGRGRLRLRTSLAGFLFAIVLVAPFVVGLINAGYADLGAWREAIAGAASNEEQGALSLDALSGAWTIFSGRDIHSLAGPELFLEYLGKIPGHYAVFSIAPIALLGATLYFLAIMFQSKSTVRCEFVAILLLLIFPIVIYIPKWTTFQLHYLIPTIPPAILILSITLGTIPQIITTSASYKIAISGSAIIIASLAISQTNASLKLLKFVDTHYTIGGFGTPLRLLLIAREQSLQIPNNEIIINMQGQFVTIDDEPTIWTALFKNRAITRVENQSTTIFPQSPATIITKHCQEQNYQIPLRPGEGCIGISERTQENINTMEFHPISKTDIRFSNGVIPLSFRWEARSACISISWKISVTTAGLYMFAIPLFDADMQLISQADGLSLPGEFWQSGDIIISQYCANDRSNSINYAGIGMYTILDNGFKNEAILNATGEEIGDLFTFELPQ